MYSKNAEEKHALFSTQDPGPGSNGDLRKYRTSIFRHCLTSASAHHVLPGVLVLLLTLYAWESHGPESNGRTMLYRVSFPSF
ncbi:hypothetical protein B0H11DRAFT_2242789 [Mycena galericulata]|nr:hypothetical protein B0H11DRAFT_2242789 [Mycena galericulata]